MQSRWMSLIEAVTNIVVGYGLAVLTQIIVFPLFGLHASLSENLRVGRSNRSGRANNIKELAQKPQPAKIH